MAVSLTTLFLMTLTASLISAFILLFPRVPLKFIQLHIGIITLPPLFALAGTVFNDRSVTFGALRFDSLSWILAVFVLTIGLIVQRYSVRYLLGDRSYRKYWGAAQFQ